MNRTVIGFLTVLAIATLLGCTSPSDSPTAETAAPTESIDLTAIANAKCPIMGGKPNGKLAANYEGKTIGFCCEGCPEKWAALSDAEKSEKLAAAMTDSGSQQHP
ncbi:MAG: hypothetical protein KDB14_04420 [Planctomycetales bacterium]|nr:hypothetical protein [Planctomycetales bacterium]